MRQSAQEIVVCENLLDFVYNLKAIFCDHFVISSGQPCTEMEIFPESKGDGFIFKTRWDELFCKFAPNKDDLEIAFLEAYNRFSQETGEAYYFNRLHMENLREYARIKVYLLQSIKLK